MPPAFLPTDCPLPFPLPLSPLENYYWRDNRPDYPASFPLDVRFSGELHKQPFERAVVEAIARHPLIGARIDDSQQWPAWTDAEDTTCNIDWATSEVPIQDLDSSPVDLREESGLRIWVRIEPGATRIRLRFQHACCDGVGALNFLEDLLILYTQQLGTSEQGIRLTPLEEEKLEARGEVGHLLGYEVAEYRMKLRDYRVTVAQWTRLLSHRPATLEPKGEAEHVGAESNRGYITGVLEAEEILGLRQAATENGVSINDLMLSDLFQVVSDWNLRAGHSEKDWLRITVPVSLRTQHDKNLPAANRLSFAFVSRRARDCKDRKQLLQSVHSEMKTIQREHLSLGFLAGLAFAGGRRGLLPWFLERDRSFATIVMSNLARPFAKTSLPCRDGKLLCGNVIIEEITGAAPIRPGTRASIAVIRYANRMMVNLKCDPKFFSPTDTKKLLDDYLSKLRTTSCQV